MQIKKTPILNFNLSFLILTLTYLIFLIVAIINFYLESLNSPNNLKKIKLTNKSI
jgi:hypothetical protein